MGAKKGPHRSKNNFFGIKISKGVTGSAPLCPIMALAGVKGPPVLNVN